MTSGVPVLTTVRSTDAGRTSTSTRPKLSIGFSSTVVVVARASFSYVPGGTEVCVKYCDHHADRRIAWRQVTEITLHVDPGERAGCRLDDSMMASNGSTSTRRTLCAIEGPLLLTSIVNVGCPAPAGNAGDVLLTTTRSARVTTWLVTVRVFDDGDGSGVDDVTVAVLVMAVSSAVVRGTVAAIVNVAEVSPESSVPTGHVTVRTSSVQPAGTEMSVSRPGGCR